MSERPVMPSELLGSGDTITFEQYVIGRLVMEEGYRFCMPSEATIRQEAAANGEPMPDEPLPNMPFVFFSEWLAQLMSESRFSAVLVKPRGAQLRVIGLTRPQGPALTATTLTPTALLRLGENALAETQSTKRLFRRLTFHIWECYDEPLTNDLRESAAQWATSEGAVKAFGWILCPPTGQFFLHSGPVPLRGFRGLIDIVNSLLSSYMPGSTWEDVFRREWLRFLTRPNVWRMGWWIWKLSQRDSPPLVIEEKAVEPEN